MKAIFAWLFLLASFANFFDVTSGHPEEPLAIGKMPGAEVGFWQFRIIFLILKAALTKIFILK